MIAFFSEHRTAGNLLMVLFLALGAAALPTLQRATFPDLPFQLVEVRVPYPGASAGDVEEAVCRRVEDAVDGVTNLFEMRCQARENVGIATLEMVESGDIDRFLNDIKTEVEAIDDFPEDVETPIISQPDRTSNVAAIAIAGPMAQPDLKAYAEDLKQRLLVVPEVSLVDVIGFSDRQIRIEVSAQTLRELGLSASELTRIVSRQSLDLPAGTIQGGEREILIRFDDERRRPRDFDNLIVVGAVSGAEIRLGDIATITDTFERDELKTEFDGKPSAQLQVKKTRGQDILEVVAAVHAFVERENAVAPPNVDLYVTQDIATIVRDRLTMLIRNGWQGLILVFLTMWLFFSFRYAFWVAMGLPVSFAGTFFAMSLMGLTFNMISLVGLLISIGLLMDDAIVIAENVAAHRDRGKSPLQAAVDGTKQVLPGVTASYLTTVCIFGPLAFLAGDIGNVLKIMPVILLLVLSVSLVEAFLILPNHLTHAMKRGALGKPRGLRARFEDLFHQLRDDYVVPIIRKTTEWRYLFVGCVLAVFFLSIAMIAGGVLKFMVFPDIDGDVVVARILMPQGTPLARTEAVVDKVVAAAKRIDREYTPRQPPSDAYPDGQPLIEHLSVLYGRNADAHESGPHVATIVMDTLSAEIRKGTSQAIRRDWRRETGNIPDVINLRFAKLQIGPAGLPIELELKGSNLDNLKSAAQELRGWLGQYAGVYDLMDDLRPGKPELRLRLREGAKSLGVDAAEIARQLRAAFQGAIADEIQVGPESFEIDVRVSRQDRSKLGDVDNFTITAPGGAQIPLGAVATIEYDRGYARINRIDSVRTVSIVGDVDTDVANSAEIIADTQTRFLPGLLERYPDVRLSLGGQSESSAETGSSLVRNFILGLLGVFILLSFLFRSYVEPVIVMLAIPMSFVGVIWGHIGFGYDLSMPSMVGFVSLAGVVVNNSILLVTFIKLKGAEGMDIVDASVEAARQRFRPAFLTSATTAMGLLPILAEGSLQAQIVQPLVTSIVCGLVVATIFILFMVPAAYGILHDLGYAKFGDNADVPAEIASTGSAEAD